MEMLAQNLTFNMEFNNLSLLTTSTVHMSFDMFIFSNSESGKKTLQNCHLPTSCCIRTESGLKNAGSGWT
jgi:hypothetical protein